MAKRKRTLEAHQSPCGALVRTAKLSASASPIMSTMHLRIAAPGKRRVAVRHELRTMPRRHSTGFENDPSPRLPHPEHTTRAVVTGGEEVRPSDETRPLPEVRNSHRKANARPGRTPLPAIRRPAQCRATSVPQPCSWSPFLAAEPVCGKGFWPAKRRLREGPRAPSAARPGSCLRS